MCRLQIWKKRSILDGNFNVQYLSKNKTMNFLGNFKEQRLIIVLVLVIP